MNNTNPFTDWLTGKKKESTFSSDPLDPNYKTPMSPSDYFQAGLLGVNAGLNYNDSLRIDRKNDDHIREMIGTEPIWDYNEMYGKDTYGGSQFQPIIRAENGAKIRTMLDHAAPINIEGGEFLILPDGTTEIAKGPKHSKGGINTILPKDTLVFSAKLKPEDSKKTFAKLAKESNISQFTDVMNNPYSSAIAINSATRMLDRNKKILAELFTKQQELNGDSSGELINEEVTFMEQGGWVEGKEYDLTEEQIQELTKQGYKIDIL